MALPILEWLPLTSPEPSIEDKATLNLNTADNWRTGPNTSNHGIGSLATTDQPLTTRRFRQYMALTATTGATYGDARFGQAPSYGEPDDYGPLLYATHRWFFRFWARASTGSIDEVNCRLIFKDSSDNVLQNTAATLSNLGTTWTFVEHVATAPVNTFHVSYQIQIKDAADGLRIVTCGLAGGRCLDFEKQQRFDTRRVRRASVVRSLAGVTQTDLFANLEACTIESNDEPYTIYQNARDWWSHAAAGGSWGYALDRESRDKNWLPQLVTADDNEPIVRPVGGERYRLSIRGAEQVLPADLL